MNDAIGSQISDYLIKPVNPNQLLLSIKKLLQNKKLVGERVTTAYQQDFAQLSMRLNDRMDAEEWMDAYKKLVYWDVELQKSQSEGMKDVFEAAQSMAEYMPAEDKEKAKKNSKFIKTAKCKINGNTAKCTICCDAEGNPSPQFLDMLLVDGRWLATINKEDKTEPLPNN